MHLNNILGDSGFPEETRTRHTLNTWFTRGSNYIKEPANLSNNCMNFIEASIISLFS